MRTTNPTARSLFAREEGAKNKPPRSAASRSRTSRVDFFPRSDPQRTGDGRSCAVTYVHIYRLEDGKIRQDRAVRYDSSILRRLGALSPS